MHFLKLKDIAFSYDTENPVFNDINIEINRNDLIVIHGDSGAGKSTFLKLFNRFCETSQGQIYLHDKDLNDYQIDKLRSNIIYLPQMPFIIDGTVDDNLSFPFSFHAHKDKMYNSLKAEEWLSYFQLDIPLSNEALKLSVGQRQRIALIRSLLLEPEVLLLDEPCSALDKNNIRLIEQKIEDLVDKSKVTVLMATHGSVGFHRSKYRVFKLENKILRELKKET